MSLPERDRPSGSGSIPASAVSKRSHRASRFIAERLSFSLRAPTRDRPVAEFALFERHERGGDVLYSYTAGAAGRLLAGPNRTPFGGRRSYRSTLPPEPDRV